MTFKESVHRQFPIDDVSLKYSYYKYSYKYIVINVDAT